ncbi:DNA-binding protein [Streptococcus hyointestinalis]|uniref:DNA-binding protein n=1 Tax=Streptococcus hyointestinalis TaxID=1337 RepID=UPI003D070BCD
MLITSTQARAIRRKIADKQLKQYEFAKEVGVASRTVPKIISGNYNAPKRIYQSVMEWLAEDY